MQLNNIIKISVLPCEQIAGFRRLSQTVAKLNDDLQFDELNNSDYTTVAFSTLYGVKGLLITSKTNSKSIFLPAAGCYDETRHTVDGPANYWSRSLRVGQYPYQAWRFYFYDNSHPINTMATDRTLALPIRPVRNQ
jgi:hypothetical protein